MSDSTDSSETHLSDWSLVDGDGELQDTETSSTTSSVEILDDDNHEVTSPGSPVCDELSPLKFVLRLPKKDQDVDTDDDLTSRDTEPDSTTSTQTFTCPLSPRLASSSFVAMTTGGDEDDSAVGSSCPSMVKQSEDREPETEGTKPVNQDLVENKAGNQSNSPIRWESVEPSKGLHREPDNDAKRLGNRQISQEELDNLRKTLDDIKGKYVTGIRNSDELFGDGGGGQAASSSGAQGFVSPDSSLSTEYSFISREDDINTGVDDGVEDDSTAADTAATTSDNNSREAGIVGVDGVEDVDGGDDGNNNNEERADDNAADNIGAVGNAWNFITNVWQMFETVAQIQNFPEQLKIIYIIFGCSVLLNVAFSCSLIISYFRDTSNDCPMAVRVKEAGYTMDDLELAITYTQQQKELDRLSVEIERAKAIITSQKAELARLQRMDSSLVGEIEGLESCCNKKKATLHELRTKFERFGSDLRESEDFKKHGVNVLCYDLCQNYQGENVSRSKRFDDFEVQHILLADDFTDCGMVNPLGRCMDQRREELVHMDILQSKVDRLEASQTVVYEQEAEIEKLKRQLSDCNVRNSKNKSEREADNTKNDSTEDKWLACQALLSDIYQQQYDEMNTKWEGMRVRMSEFAQTHFPTEWYDMLQKTGVFKTTESTSSGRNQRQEKSFGTADESDNSRQDDKKSTFVDSVFKVMNETRGKVHQTWEKVKNMSDNLWEKHGSSLQRLGNTFTENIQSLSNKFQRKVAKKINKWFNKGKKQTEKQDGHCSKGAKSRDDQQDGNGKGDNFRNNKQDSHHGKGKNERGRKQERQEERRQRKEAKKQKRARMYADQVDEERRKAAQEYYTQIESQALILEKEGKQVKEKFKQLWTDIKDCDYQAYRNKPDWWNGFRSRIREFTSTFWFDLLKDKCQQYISAQEYWWKGQQIIVRDFYCDWQWAVSKPSIKRGRTCLDLPRNCLRQDWRYLVPEAIWMDDADDNKIDDTEDKDNTIDDDDDDGEIRVEGEDNWYWERAADREYQHQEPDTWYFLKKKEKEARKYFKNYQEHNDDEDGHIRDYYYGLNEE